MIKAIETYIQKQTKAIDVLMKQREIARDRARASLKQRVEFKGTVNVTDPELQPPNEPEALVTHLNELRGAFSSLTTRSVNQAIAADGFGTAMHMLAQHMHSISDMVPSDTKEIVSSLLGVLGLNIQRYAVSRVQSDRATPLKASKEIGASIRSLYDDIMLHIPYTAAARILNEQVTRRRFKAVLPELHGPVFSTDLLCMVGCLLEGPVHLIKAETGRSAVEWNSLLQSQLGEAAFSSAARDSNGTAKAYGYLKGLATASKGARHALAQQALDETRAFLAPAEETCYIDLFRYQLCAIPRSLFEAGGHVQRKAWALIQRSASKPSSESMMSLIKVMYNPDLWIGNLVLHMIESMITPGVTFGQFAVQRMAVYQVCLLWALHSEKLTILPTRGNIIALGSKPNFTPAAVDLESLHFWSRYDIGENGESVMNWLVYLFDLLPSESTAYHICPYRILLDKDPLDPRRARPLTDAESMTDAATAPSAVASSEHTIMPSDPVPKHYISAWAIVRDSMKQAIGACWAFTFASLTLDLARDGSPANRCFNSISDAADTRQMLISLIEISTSGKPALGSKSA